MHQSTAWVLLFAGVIFVWSLLLGVRKWQEMSTSSDGKAHPYIDIGHRAALLYSFATTMIAVFVQTSAWPEAVNFTAACAAVLMFVVAIANYTRLGLTRATVNQMHNPPKHYRAALAANIIGEIGGFLVLLVGFAVARL
ncbi:hypothetical protein [Kitasatospora cineracea]|uniref:Integral membrane protein n=1 Tax=Kitasatospora cineracea TaxID=88074 RepID=A0A3N4RQD3_9ACTN|nr:hypothetical protein [Kitasatospora cineracea]ROR42596.1 hypothetical protein EDD39_0721 [Kitasatospora cineracea]RPE33091.1 hypothetical protein EDD38_1370 [Kitasatospora cineracea]